MTDQQHTGTETAREALTLSRTFDAPRELVFAAWTEPERLAQWWGSPGMPIGESRLPRCSTYSRCLSRSSVPSGRVA